MAKTHRFTKKNKNRYRKIYNYIRRKPVVEYASDGSFTMIVGSVDFSDSSGPVTHTFDESVTFTNVPVVTAIAVDSESNDAADVNIFVTSVSTTAIQFESSAPFIGKVHFQVIPQD